MADTQFDVAMAKAWENEVRQELQAVDNLLIRVGRVLQSDPVEDDTVLKNIYETGEKMDNAARDLGKQFEATMDALTKIIAKVESIVQESLDKLAQFKSGFHLG